VEDLRSAINANDQDAIRTKREALEQKVYEVSSKIYQATQQTGGDPGQGQGGYTETSGNNGGAYTDASYTEVPDDNN
ncbi:MAG: molecular chaperone DnaK, partial [Oscillospiraceae bacterium]|nr:molecular chaperone DnaK [Oscillospiraceae bacterium]